jgi:hypothetical protein
MQVHSQTEVTTCEGLAEAMADRSVLQILVLADIRTSACMPGWSSPQVTLARNLRITGVSVRPVTLTLKQA